MVEKNQPDARLVLVGKCDRTVPFRPGDDTTINDLIKNYKIDDSKITFAGEVSDVDKYYSQASLLLLASNNEGFGMVINEAACFGVPSVCNRIPGLEDLVVEGVNGFLTDQDDIKSMADAVCKILSDEKLRARLSANAKIIVKKFDATGIGNKWKYLVDTLLGDNTYAQKHSKLQSSLAYKVLDYKDFSKILFNDLNSIIATNLEDRIKLLKTKKGRKGFKIEHMYDRFSRSLKKNGVSKTFRIIAKKSYRKIRK